MKTTMRVVALTAAIFAGTASLAHAQRSWNVCGGNAFNTCASVQLEVVGQRVTVRVWNLSGFYGTWPNTVFTGVGFENIGNVGLANPANVSMTGPVRGGDAPGAWGLAESKSIGGGVKLDMTGLSGGANGSVDNSIASGCYSDALSPQLPAGSNDLWMNPCRLPTGATDPGYVVFSFDITGTWDLASTELLVKGQNGPNGASTQCFTGDGSCNVVPEPVTMILLGSGLAGVGGAGYLRRRRRGGDAH